MSSAALLDRGQPTFQDLLRSWRKHNKISQGGLSSLTGISQRHLSFLESGRSSPSRDMVLRLADAFDLPLREKNAMLNAAGFSSVYTERKLDDDAMTEARHALSVMLKHHEPYGAIVIDRNWNLLMMNDANLKVFSHFLDPLTVWEDLGGHQPNMLRVTLHEKGLRPYIQNFDEFVGYFMQQLEHELSSNPFNRQARELLDEIKTYPDLPTASSPGAPLKPFLPLRLKNRDIELAMFTMVSTFGTPQDITLQEIRIETFFPADEQTEAFIQSLK